MRKVVCSLLVLSMLVCLTACGVSSDAGKKDSSASKSSITSEYKDNVKFLEGKGCKVNAFKGLSYLAPPDDSYYSSDYNESHGSFSYTTLAGDYIDVLSLVRYEDYDMKVSEDNVDIVVKVLLNNMIGSHKFKKSKLSKHGNLYFYEIHPMSSSGDYGCMLVLVDGTEDYYKITATMYTEDDLEFDSELKQFWNKETWDAFLGSLLYVKK